MNHELWRSTRPQICGLGLCIRVGKKKSRRSRVPKIGTFKPFINLVPNIFKNKGDLNTIASLSNYTDVFTVI